MSESVPLKEYIERIFDEREKALNLAFTAQQDALRTASTALEGRLERLNELRDLVQSDRADYLTKDTYESKHEALITRINSLERFNAWILGIGAAIGVAGGLIGGILGHKLGF